MIPLRDRNPTRATPVVTLGLIAACFVVFAYELTVSFNGGDQALEQLFDQWGAVPAKISASIDRGDWLSTSMLAIVTSTFLHGGWPHILGNMLYLWIFGNNVEDRLGRLPFLAFYLLGGIVAGLAQVWIAPDSNVPLVGASGAIAAVLGVYVVVWPGARILSLVFLGFFFQLAEIPALVILGLWFVLQLLYGEASLGAATAEGGVAFFAHIGGFVLGIAVGLVARLARTSAGLASRPSGGPMG